MEKGMKKTYQAVYFCNLIQGPYKLNSDSIYMLIAEVKASACNLGDLGSIPGSEDPLEKETAIHSSILA